MGIKYEQQIMTIQGIDNIYLGWSNTLEVSGEGFECTLELNEELLLKLADRLTKLLYEKRACAETV